MRKVYLRFALLAAVVHTESVCGQITAAVPARTILETIRVALATSKAGGFAASRESLEGSRALCASDASGRECRLLYSSGLGSLFTWRSTSSWEDANPFTASVVGLLSLGGAAVLAAFARIGGRGAGLVCVVLGTAMIVMWWFFATN